MGNGSIGVLKGKVFCREWLNFETEWLFWRVQRQRLKVEARTLRVKPREESPQPKLRGRVTHPLQETKQKTAKGRPPQSKTKSKSSLRVKGRPPAFRRNLPNPPLLLPLPATVADGHASRHAPLNIARRNDAKEAVRCPSASREFHDEDRKPVDDWDPPLYQAYEYHPVNNRQPPKKWDQEASL